MQLTVTVAARNPAAIITESDAYEENIQMMFEQIENVNNIMKNNYC